MIRVTKWAVSLLLVLLAVGSVVAEFSTVSVDDVDQLELVQKKADNFEIREGGLNTRGQVLRAGGLCDVGNHIRFLECSDADDTECTDQFETLWEKTDANDLLFYRDYEETNGRDTWGTYWCYTEKEEAVVETAAEIVTAPSTPVSTRTNRDCGISVKEGEEVRLQFTMNDPDADELQTTFDFGSINSRVQKRDDTYIWQTRSGDEGIYDFEATTSDGELSSTTRGCIEVVSSNRRPQVSANNLIIPEGGTVRADVTCTDADGDRTELEFSGWMTSDSKRVDFDDAGTHRVTVTCTDEKGASSTTTFTVDVTNVNRAPEISWRLVR